MSSKKIIAVVDYGVGNLGSLMKAFKQSVEGTDVAVVLTEEIDIIADVQAVVLPGVGAYRTGMEGLQKRGLVDIIKQRARDNVPLLGICLGAQLFFDVGEEFGQTAGLGIIPGSVAHFPQLENKEKVPHIGWNAVTPVAKGGWEQTIFKTVKPGSFMYFVHSYSMVPENKENIFATTEYGGHTFCSVAKKGNVYGCQFHPEKSGPVGVSIIKNFIDLI